MADFEVTFVDVGHGDATLIKLPGGQFALVDVFRCPDNGIDLFKLLDDVLPDGDDGRKRLEILAITHAHDDHITGIGDLYDRYQVGELWLPQHGEKLAISGSQREEFDRVQEEHPDDQTFWPKGSRSAWRALGEGDEVSVRCFSPPGFVDPAEELTEEEAKRVVHENCVVLRFTYKNLSVMLTGDSNKPCWERVVGYYADRTDDEGLAELKSDYLHASHHGSRTFYKDSKDDSEPYLDALEAIDPEIVVISVGPDSKHDHPHDDMLGVYNDRVDAENVLQTCVTGTMRLEIEADGTARLISDDSLSYDGYGWDDDGDDGGGGGSKRSIPPTAPPPGHHATPRRAPRERYG
jgi:beta-lactamase superfamily II metal-dependent hydrolase